MSVSCVSVCVIAVHRSVQSYSKALVRMSSLMIEDLHFHHHSIINEDDKYDEKSSIINDFFIMRMMIRMKSSVRPIELVGQID